MSVDKALLVVELLMRAEAPMSARDIADHLHLNRTTAHRLLNALMHRSWVEKAIGGATYRLGARFVALAGVAVRQRDLFAEMRPVLEEISRKSRETVHVGVLDGFEVVHVDKIESPERVGVSSQIGSRGALHTTGLGKALLAASPASFIAAYLDASTAPGYPMRIADPAAFRRELALTRERGYSVDDEEDSIGVRCAGVAVLGADESPLFAISLTGPSPRFTRERIDDLVPDLLATAKTLSRVFGHDDQPEAIAITDED
ncbi:MAG: IclR family transcriptional regulator [Thermomicrobiales bacterium]|nr:IclR family transcriptional regulator [Thermomicrobiales bacterium]